MEPSYFHLRSSQLRITFRAREGSQPLPVHAQKLAGMLLCFAAPVLALQSAQSAQTTPSVVSSPRPHANRTYLGQDIFVASGQQIHNATCLFCSVQVEGDVSGNILVLFGNLTVTGRVSGNTTVISGNTVVDSQARISGRTTVIHGNAVYESDESLSGDAFVLGGHISNFAGRGSSRHRLALSPTLFTAGAVVIILLFAVLLFPRSRRRVPVV